MRRGKLDHIISIQKQGPILRDGGQRIAGDWVDVINDLPAMFVPKAGKENFANAEQQSQYPASFIIDYHPSLDDINTQWRVSEGGNVWDIVSFVYNGRRNSKIMIYVTRKSHK